MVTGDVFTGATAGGVSASPVRRSNSAPWSQHSILKFEISPSESDASEWLQTSPIAKTSDPTLATQIASPFFSMRTGFHSARVANEISDIYLPAFASSLSIRSMRRF